MSDNETKLEKIETLSCVFEAKRDDKAINGSGEWQPLATQMIIKPEALEASRKTAKFTSKHIQISFSYDVTSSGVLGALKNEFGDYCDVSKDGETINVFHERKEDIGKILKILSSKNAITKHDVVRAVKAFGVENPIVTNNGFVEIKEYPAANLDSTSRIIGSQKGLV